MFFRSFVFLVLLCRNQVVGFKLKLNNRNERLFIYLGFSYGDGTFSPPMDVTNQIQNGAQHTSGNSNYSSGSGGDSPTSLSPGKNNELFNMFFS